MKRPRIRVRWLLLPAFLLLPPLLWALLLSVVPTDWARQRFVARMSKVSGRTVRIATLRMGTLGGIYLTGLEIGAPGTVGDPWLKVAEAHINVSPLQLVCGQVEPTKTIVRGVRLRVLRRENGSFELDDLIQGTAPGAPETDSGSSSCPLGNLSLRIRKAKVTVIDMPTRTRLEFQGIEGHALFEGAGRRATIQELQGSLSGGTFEVVAHLDRSARSPSFEGELRARGIGLNDGMKALGYLAPVLSGESGNLDGKLDINLYLRGQGDSRHALRQSVVGHGTISLDPIQLDGSRFLDELASVLDLPEQGRIGAIKSDFLIKQGRIASDNLTVSVTKLPIVLSGWTDFDGRVNYRVRTDSLTDRLPSKARDFLAELSIDTRELSTLKVEGVVEAPIVLLDGVPLNGASSPIDPSQPRGDDRSRLRELGRRLRDRILR
jgi:AsmA-like C-terminal region